MGMMLQVKWQLMHLCIIAVATVVVPGSSGFNEPLSLEYSSPIPGNEARVPNFILAQKTSLNGPTVQPPIVSPSIKSPSVHETIQGPMPYLSPRKSTSIPPQHEAPTQTPDDSAPPSSAVPPEYSDFPAARAPQSSTPPPVAALSHGLTPPLPTAESPYYSTPPPRVENETSNDSNMIPSAKPPHTSSVSPVAKAPEYIPQLPTAETPESLPLVSYAPPPRVSAEAPVVIPQPPVAMPPPRFALPLAAKPPESNPPLPVAVPPQGLTPTTPTEASPVLPLPSPEIPPRPSDTPLAPAPQNASPSPPQPASPDAPPLGPTVPSNASLLPPSMSPPSDPPTTFPSPSPPLPPNAFSPPPQLVPPTASAPPPQLNPPIVSSPPSQPNPPIVSPPPSQPNPPIVSSPPSPPPQLNPPIIPSPPPQLDSPIVSSPPPQLIPPIANSPLPQLNPPIVSSPPPQMNPPIVPSPPPQMNPPIVPSPPPQVNPPIVPSPPPQMNAPIVSSPPPQLNPPTVSSPPPQLNPPLVSSPPPQLNPPLVSSPPPQLSPPLVSSPPPQISPPMVSSPPPQLNPPMVSSPSPQLTPPMVSSPPPQPIPPIASSPPPQLIPLPASPPNSAPPSNASVPSPLRVSPPESSSPPLAVPPHASSILSPPLPSHSSPPLPRVNPPNASPPAQELPFVSPPRSSIVPRSVPPHPSPVPLAPTSPVVSSRPSYAPPPSKPSRFSVPPSPVMQQNAPAAPPRSSQIKEPPKGVPLPSLTSPEPSPASKTVPEAAPPAHQTTPRSQPPSSHRIEAPKHSSFMRSNSSDSPPAMSPLSSPPEAPEISSAPSPLPRAPPGHSGTPSLSPKISPSGSSTRNTKKPHAPPIRSLPPPPPNADCAYLTCAEPFTNTPPGSPCGCVWPMQVGLRLSVALYTFFPLVSELSREIAAGVYMKQSQVRVMGANAASEQSEKTIALVNLVPLTGKFDNVTSELTFQRFWQKKVVINKSIFGDYDVLYVHYPGLPPSPPMAPADMAVINGMPYSVQDPNAHPLGVDVTKQKHKQKLNGIAIVAIVFSAIIAVLICCSVAWVLVFRHKNRDPQSADPRALPSLARSSGPTGNSTGSGPGSSMSVESSLATYAGSAKTFSTSEIEKATDNLNPSRVIGEGGFGLVYGGVLEDETNVAVKVLKREDQQGGREFLAEVEMLSRLHHRNLVKLIGICTDERLRCLVYELIPNGSVDSHLHGPDKEIAPLDWPSRMKIALGAARGLAYLHEDSSPRVIHRDFKSSNILLENDFTPKVSDFGLARSAMDGESRHISTRVMGTFGYVAPEYAMTGHLLVKSDVYSYGVVLLELLTGRKPVDMSQPPGQENLVAWTRPFLTTKESLELILDHSLGPNVPLESAAKVAAIASMCVQPEVSHRPFMGEVVQALKLVCNECDDSKDGDSSPASPGNLSVDYEAKTSPVSEKHDYLHIQYSPQKYFPTHNVEKGLSVSENFGLSAQVDRQTSDSFRRHSASGPLKTAKGRHFWQRIGRESNGSVSEHGIMYRLWAGSH